MDKREKLIQQYMKALHITKAEAEKLYLDDMEDLIGDEGEALEAKAKKNQHREKSDKPRKPIQRERKVDNTKGYLLGLFRNQLEGIEAAIIQTKTETEIHFEYQGESYVLKLTKHRPPKK